MLCKIFKQDLKKLLRAKYFMAVYCAQAIINTVVSSMSCFVVVYFLKAIAFVYLAFTSKKQVSKGLLTGDQKRTFSLSKHELRLCESERVSPNARSLDF